MSTASEVYNCRYGRQVMEKGLEEMENSDPGDRRLIRCSRCRVSVRFCTPENPFETGAIAGQLELGLGDPNEDYVWVAMGNCGQ